MCNPIPSSHSQSHCLSTQQTLPVDSYSSEDYDVFMVSGRTCIEEGDGAQVLSIILDEKNQVGSFSTQMFPETDKVFPFLPVQDIVRCMGWNLLPPVIQVLLKKEDKNLNQCLAIFNHLLEVLLLIVL